MIAPAMAVGKLHGLTAQSEPEQLMAEADTEYRHGPVGELAQCMNRVSHRCRVARAVRAAARRHLPLERPGRPGSGAIRDSYTARARRRVRADIRYLPRPSVARARSGR